ncbi:type VI secretion system tip protein TssI/VgrG [Massilia sp. METH4]|uniref:type VI secretion system Vgr family protein n=1 Tax=Massilia sp. METH4 TaxID=3123041 RepID=UPI0030CBC082
MSLIPPTVVSFDRLQQTGRLLRSHFPNDDGPEANLVVNTLCAQEELSRSFRFDVELLSDDVSIPLKSMIGKMMTVSLVRDNGTERHFNGYITEFRYMKTDGGFVYYYAVLEPWLAFAKLRKDCVSFLACSVLEMTEKTFAHYKEHDWKPQMRGEDAKITCMNQYNETDYNHLHRRWEAAGLYYWYEHRLDGHTLHLSDDSTIADPIDECGARDMEPGTIPYRAFAGSAESDGIRQWQAVRRVGPSSMALGSFDYKNPMPQAVSSESMNRQGDLPSFDVYENTGAYGYRDWQDGEPLAKRRMEEADRMTQYFEAEGNDRSALPGRSFMLADHHSGSMNWPFRQAMLSEPIGKREYLIVSVRHWAGNNLNSAKREPSYYRNDFTCLRKTVPWRPGRHFHSNPPPSPGVQTAIVTGPQGEEIHTDGLGRITIQFHWDRQGKRDENSSAWVRVAMPMAGRQFGQIGLPRVGQEVVVQFLGENPDRPIVTGVVYNAEHEVPWQLSAQRALSGLRSREVGGTRGSQLVLDDTKDEIQAQLRCDHLHSQLSLGKIHRLEQIEGRGEHRGDGFELRSDGHGVLRAAQGMLLSTDARQAAAGSASDMSETIQRLRRATENQERLASLSQHYGAQEESQQDHTVEELRSQNSAIHHGESSASSKLTQPHLVLSSPAGLAVTSAGCTHIASDRDVAVSSGNNVSIASNGGLFASIGKTLRLFVHTAGMKLIAAAGKIEIEAQSDNVEVIAHKVAKILSDTDWVEIRGKKGVRLHGFNNFLEIGETVQFFTESPVRFNGNLETLAAKSMSQAFNERPEDCRFDQEVNFLDSEGKPVPNVEFEITRDDEGVVSGKSSIEGSTGIQRGCEIEYYTVRWKGDLP